MKAAELVTIADLARSSGVSTRTLLYRLTVLAKRDGGAWMLRTPGKIWVNTTVLRASHPAFFESQDIPARVQELEERADLADRQDEAQARALGNISGRVADLKNRADVAEERDKSTSAELATVAARVDALEKLAQDHARVRKVVTP